MALSNDGVYDRISMALRSLKQNKTERQVAADLHEWIDGLNFKILELQEKLQEK